MTIRKLVPIDVFFKNISVEIPEKELNFDINKEKVQNLDKKVQLQKLNYILTHAKCFNIEKYLDNEDINKYIWYVKGVYSTNFANVYYDIAKYDNLLETYDQDILTYKNKLAPSLSKSKDLLSKIVKTFNITTEKEFNDILEFISSIIFIKNNMNLTDDDKIKNFLLKHKNKFKKDYDDYYAKTNMILNKL